MDENSELNKLIILRKSLGLSSQQVSNELRDTGAILSKDAVNSRYARHKGEYLKESIPSKESVFPTDFLPPGFSPKNSSVITEEALRAKYDCKFLLNIALGKLKPGEFIPKNEFITSSGIQSTNNWQMALGSEEVKRYYATAGRDVYFSHPDSIYKMRQEGVLI